MFNICRIEDCTGCAACLNSCHHNALTMVYDNCGFIYPSIDESKCTNCGLCKSSCPNISYPEKRKPSKCGIGYAKDGKEQLSSTSGGIASAVSRFIIQNNGIVYGCSFINTREIRHIRVDSFESIEKLKGSKYAQSNIGFVFRSVKDDLCANRIVLFVGTPCQVAGLLSYLHKGYDNLYTMDFVCHGVPSQQILFDSINGNVSLSGDEKIAFRRKNKAKNNKSEYGVFVTDRDGKNIYEGVHPKDDYITAFLCALTYRTSCYNCHYASPKRVSDITLGDFPNKVKFENKLPRQTMGLSMITINSEKGGHLFDMIKCCIEVIPIDYEELLKNNGQLNRPSSMHESRADFISLYPKVGFKQSLGSILNKERRKIKSLILRGLIKKILFSIPFVGNS